LVLVKNEEFWLPYVLKQTEGYFKNYVIYDVGSTDNSSQIIDWFYERNKHKAEVIVRKLPHCEPDVQGTFRNAMIPEGKQPVYLIMDGDEIYSPAALERMGNAAKELNATHTIKPRIRYGVVTRTEVTEDLTLKYVQKRSHHRLYTSDAYWTGTHPGERAGYKQDGKSEIKFDTIDCLHLHNTWRSPREADAVKRMRRKTQDTYHPGNVLGDLNLLDEYPALRKPIEHFKVSPALKILQEKRK